jgi:hypothetical protein
LQSDDCCGSRAYQEERNPFLLELEVRGRCAAREPLSASLMASEPMIPAKCLMLPGSALGQFLKNYSRPDIECASGGGLMASHTEHCGQCLSAKSRYLCAGIVQ